MTYDESTGRVCLTSAYSQPERTYIEVIHLDIECDASTPNPVSVESDEADITAMFVDMSLFEPGLRYTGSILHNTNAGYEIDASCTSTANVNITSQCPPRGSSQAPGVFPNKVCT